MTDPKTADAEYLRAQQQAKFSLSMAQIGSIAHEANRQLTRILKDVPVQPKWDLCGEDMQASTIRGVMFHLNRVTPATPGESHREWMRERAAQGWVLGPVKDMEKKTHPAMVPFEQLPVGVQLKDVLFTSIVTSLLAQFPKRQR